MNYPSHTGKLSMSLSKLLKLLFHSLKLIFQVISLTFWDAYFFYTPLSVGFNWLSDHLLHREDGRHWTICPTPHAHSPRHAPPHIPLVLTPHCGGGRALCRLKMLSSLLLLGSSCSLWVLSHSAWDSFHQHGIFWNLFFLKKQSSNRWFNIPILITKMLP